MSCPNLAFTLSSLCYGEASGFKCPWKVTKVRNGDDFRRKVSYEAVVLLVKLSHRITIIYDSTYDCNLQIQII